MSKRRKRVKPRRKFFKVWSEPKTTADLPESKSPAVTKKNKPPTFKMKDVVVPHRDIIREYAQRVRPYNKEADKRAEAALRKIFGNAIPKAFHPDPDDALSRDQLVLMNMHREKLFAMFHEVDLGMRVAIIPGRLWLYWNETRSKVFWIESKDGVIRKSIGYGSKDRAMQVINNPQWIEILSDRDQAIAATSG